MKVRVLSGAFIIEGQDFLMMKRAENKKIAPGMWAGVGGHSEPYEINDPKATCLREIYEETGIEVKNLNKLDLKYIILRRDKEEITLIYYFIGSACTRYYEDKTQEGKLYWISESELLYRPMSFEVRKILEHYREIGYRKCDINVGTVGTSETKPTMHWNTLDKWEGLTGLE